jgi:hypothetical protein
MLDKLESHIAERKAIFMRHKRLNIWGKKLEEFNGETGNFRNRWNHLTK